MPENNACNTSDFNRIGRYLFKGQKQWGILRDNNVHALNLVWPTLQEGLANGWQAMAHAAVENKTIAIPVMDVQWLPPVEPESKILCVGLNYGKHVSETGKAEAAHPSIFLRHIDSFSGHNTPIEKPSCSQQFDFEGELAVVIGKTGRHISVDQAMQYVGGYTCMAENSVRDFQKHTAQVTAGKNFDRSGALGPWIIASEMIPDPQSLQLTTRLNEQVVQDASLSDLIFPIPTLIAYISTFCTLRPGDIIATGTPEGIGFRRKPPLFMQAGDVLEIDIPGVATLRNAVINEQTN